MSSSQDYPKLGRYQVINRIASGGMAEVFLAKAVGAMGFQRLVAIKLIHANFTRDEEFVKMFIDEARIAMHLHHRNIVQVFDLDKVGDTYFIAMEFVHGVNLYDVYERIASKNRWIEPSMALYLVAEISKGLHFAHTRTGPDGKPLGIVHRDISPQNVLLSFEGEVKITDFGIATAAERLHQTAAGIVKGKYAYMAPERLQEQPIDNRVDVFSVGVLLYELLVGENPYAGPSAVETIENVLHKDVPPPSARGAPVSKALDEICLRALAKNPEDRYASGQHMADAVTEYAMELTHARKDMAAGDNSVAQLLAELFPEKVASPTAGDPMSLELPGVEPASMIDTSPDSQEKPAFIETQEDIPANSVSQALEETNDFDAPTVLRMTPMKEPGAAVISGDPMVESSSITTMPPNNEGEIPQDHEWEDSVSGDKTTPTELPMNFGPADITAKDNTGPNPDTSPTKPVSDDPFAQTLPSGGVDPIASNGMSGLTVEPAPETPHGLKPISTSVTPHGSNTSESSEQLVVPVSNPDMPKIERKPSRMNMIAVAFLGVAVLVVVAALVMTRNDVTTLDTVMLAINTQPSGAAVTINGRPHQEKTPTRISVGTGEQVYVELRLEGYEPLTKTIKPLQGTQPSINEALTPLEGSLTILPTPADAKVIVAGKEHQGKVTVPGLKIGRPFQVVVEKEGFESFVQELTLSAGSRQQTLAVPMAAERSGVRKRRVRLVAPHGSWASVFHNGRALGKTPVTTQLPVGPIKVRVQNASINKVIDVEVPRNGNLEIPLSY